MPKEKSALMLRCGRMTFTFIDSSFQASHSSLF